MRRSPRTSPRKAAMGVLDSPQIGQRKARGSPDKQQRQRSDSSLVAESRAAKVKKSLQMQKDQGLISEEVYHEMLKSSLGVMTAAESSQIVPGGQTVRVMVGNERRQLRGGMITPEEFNTLKKQAVRANITNKQRLREEKKQKQSELANSSSSGRMDSAEVNALVRDLTEAQQPQHKSGPPAAAAAAAAAARDPPKSPKGPLGGSRKKLPALPDKNGKERRSPRLRKVRSPVQSPRAMAAKSPKSSPRNAAAAADYGSIGPVIRRRKKITLHEGFGDLPALPEHGKLVCRIVDFAQTKTKSGTKPAFVMEVISAEKHLRYRVTRLYKHFFAAQQLFRDEFPETSFCLKSTSEMKQDGKLKLSLAKQVINDFLALCCDHEEILRSFTFVNLINPKTFPTLGEISKSPIKCKGWVELKKLNKIVTQWTRFYAVLFKSTIYFFGSREPNGVASSRIELEFCDVDLEQNDTVVCFRLYTLRRVINLRVSDLAEAAVSWYKSAREALAEHMHAKYIPLLSVKEAQEFEQKQRSLSSVGFCSAPVVASCARKFYHKDRPDTIAYTSDGKIKAGTPEKLVEKMLDMMLAPMSTVRAFLLTYQSFLQSDRLLDQLMSYYERPPEKKKGKSGSDTLTGVQLRVLVIMQRWLEVNPRDFIDEPMLASSLKSFFEKVSNKQMSQKMLTLLHKNLVKKGGAHMPKALPVPGAEGVSGTSSPLSRGSGPQLMFEDPSLNSAFPNVRRVTTKKPEQVEKNKSKGIVQRILSSSQSHDVGPTDALPALFPRCGWDLMSVATVVIARQITLLDHHIYCSINPRELLYQSWNKESKQEEAPNVLRFIDRFNILSGIVTTCVCRVRDLHTRAAVVARWLDIAEELLLLQNFSALMSIVAGLRNASVNRLRKTWDVVRKRWEKQAAAFERHQELVNSGSNFKNLRSRLGSCGGSAVPYLGITLTDLVFHDEGNPDHIPSPVSTAPPLVNFEKRIRYSQVIADVLIYQKNAYPLAEIPEIQQYLLRMRPISDDQCYKLSLRAEPRRKSKK